MAVCMTALFFVSFIYFREWVAAGGLVAVFLVSFIVARRKHLR